jgi:CRP-like cAMP-binding protein
MLADLSLFKKDPNFRGFKADDWDVLSSYLEQKTFPAKTHVFKENDPGDGFYWVQKGKIKIARHFIPEGKKKVQENILTVLSPGAIFGEMALIDRPARSADAIAESDAELLHLSHSQYERLCKEHPGTAMAIQDLLVLTLCARIREANRNFETILFLV